MGIPNDRDRSSFFDAFMREEQEAQRAANARVMPWQSAIVPGQYFYRDSELGFRIYGEVLQEEEPLRKGLENYRFIHGYSVACVEGEMGDIYVCQITKIIPKEEFEEARARSWR